MVKSRKLFLIILVLMGLLLSTTAAIAGCGDEKTTTSATTSTSATKDTAVVINDRALKVFASSAKGEYGSNSIAASDLSTKLADPAESAKIFVLDIRSKADYDAGHIEGAIQVDFAKWAAPESLAMLPKDKKIIVVCTAGNTAAQTAAGLRMLGFDAASLKAGMAGWAVNATTDTVVADLNAASYPVVMTPAGSSSPPPETTSFEKPSDSNYKVLAEKANEVMMSMPTQGDYALNTIMPAMLSNKLSGAEKDKLFVLDTRTAEDFDKGHIDGAVNIPLRAIAVPDNLKMLPKDKQIVVVCYTGNTAAQATMILRMLDYDASVLKYGIMGWDGTGKDAYITYLQAAANPVVTS